MGEDELEELRQDFRRYNSEDFLDATAAVCALSAIADDKVRPDELHSIEHLVLRDPALQDIDAKQLQNKLTENLSALEKDRAQTEKFLSDKVRRVAGDHEMAKALMRAAYLIIVSDRGLRTREMEEFGWLCGLLELDADQVWEELSHRFLLWNNVDGARLIRVPAGDVAFIVNQSPKDAWRVFESFDTAKDAAANLYQRAVEHYNEIEQAERAEEMERRLADLPALTARETPAM